MNVFSPQTQFIFDDATSLDATHCMLYPDPDAIDSTVLFLFLCCQLPTTWLLLWLNDDNTFDIKALKSPILIQCRSCGKLVGLTICCPFVMTGSFPGFSQTPDPSILIYDNNILDRMVLLLAAIIPFLFFRIAWAIYRPLCSIVKINGGALARCSALRSGDVLSSAFGSCSCGPMSANSMRISRLGRSPFCLNVRFRTVCKRWIHMFAFGCRIPNKLAWTSWVGACLR